MQTLLKCHATGETAAIVYNEFKDRIREGRVDPRDQVQDNILTNNQWWAVDNLRIFHRLSPVLHAKGPHLVAREMAEEKDQRIREAAQIEAAKEEALAREYFHLAKSEDGFIPSGLHQFLIACHEEPLAGHEFAVRFIYVPSFHPPLFVRASCEDGQWKLYYQAGRGGPPIIRALRTQDEVPRILDLVESVNLAGMPLTDGRLGLDGATWAMEVSRQKQYAFRHRWSPTTTWDKRETAFVALGRYLVGLSQLLSSTDEMY